MARPQVWSNEDAEAMLPLNGDWLRVTRYLDSQACMSSRAASNDLIETSEVLRRRLRAYTISLRHAVACATELRERLRGEAEAKGTACI